MPYWKFNSAMLGELMSAGLGQQGMLWVLLFQESVCIILILNYFLQLTSPACTELEIVMLDWMAKALKLPEAFLSTSGHGGGVIQV